jgi:hypothetical protein
MYGKYVIQASYSFCIIPYDWLSIDLDAVGVLVYINIDSVAVLPMRIKYYLKEEHL